MNIGPTELILLCVICVIPLSLLALAGTAFFMLYRRFGSLEEMVRAVQRKLG